MDAAALVELAGSQGHDVEGVYDCPGFGKLLAGGALDSREAVHRHHLNPLTPVLVALGEPGLEDLLRTPRGHVQQPGGTTAIVYGGQVDDHRGVLVVPLGVPPYGRGTSRLIAKRAGGSSIPRTSTLRSSEGCR